MKLPDSELCKEREIIFSQLPVGQASVALDFLADFQKLEARLSGERHITVCYNLRNYNMQFLLEALENAGFHLDNSIMSLVMRALAIYTEEVQSHNIEMPERLIKKNDEAYVRAWEQHPHGDHDDIPPEWREYH